MRRYRTFVKLPAPRKGAVMRDLFEELQRRNVARVAFVYVIAGWLTMQVVDIMFPALKLPEWMISAVAALVLIGFPFALIFAWAFEMTPEGIKREKDVDRSESITRETGLRLNRSALIILTIAVAFLLADKFLLRPASTATVPAETEIAVTDGKPSIAVLPFVNMSADQENEYFSDGLSEELLNLLAKIPDLHVAGRTSSFAFKGLNTDLRDIGQQLNVEHILEGSVRRSNTSLRITAQLIDTENGYHLWSETYDAELDDVFQIQDEISAAVVDALKVTLLRGGQTTRHSTRNLEAYEHYLRAMYLTQDMSEENLVNALDELRAAIEIDPDYALAYATLADLYSLYISGWVGSSGVDFFDRGFSQVREYAQRAVDIDPNLSASHVGAGVVSFAVEWRFEESAGHFEKALELEPANITALNWLGTTRLVQGRFEEAQRLSDVALRLDPINNAVRRQLGDTYGFGDDQDTAIEVYSSILDDNPGIARIHGRMARVYMANGDLDAAAEHYAAEPVDWVHDMGDIMLAIARDGDWRPMAVAYEEHYGYLNAYQLAEIYAYAGDTETAFQWLSHTATYRDPGATWSKISQFLRPLHDDPRWAPYIKSVGLAD